MDSTSWNTLPELGIDELDREHREILNLIITMRNTLRSNASKAVKHGILEVALEDGICFLQKHFLAEESLMKESNYPEYVSHKEEHEYFLTRVEALYGKVQTGSMLPTIESLNLLGNLLHHHVLETDRPLLPHLMKFSLLESRTPTTGAAEPIIRKT